MRSNELLPSEFRIARFLRLDGTSSNFWAVLHAWPFDLSYRCRWHAIYSGFAKKFHPKRKKKPRRGKKYSISSTLISPIFFLRFCHRSQSCNEITETKKEKKKRRKETGKKERKTSETNYNANYVQPGQANRVILRLYRAVRGIVIAKSILALLVVLDSFPPFPKIIQRELGQGDCWYLVWFVPLTLLLPFFPRSMLCRFSFCIPKDVIAVLRLCVRTFRFQLLDSWHHQRQIFWSVRQKIMTHSSPLIL